MLTGEITMPNALPGAVGQLILEGNTLLVDAAYETEPYVYQTTVQVFVLWNDVWTHEAWIEYSYPQFYERKPVDLLSDTLILLGDNDAIVYTRAGGVWTQE